MADTLDSLNFLLAAAFLFCFVISVLEFLFISRRKRVPYGLVAGVLIGCLIVVCVIFANACHRYELQSIATTDITSIDLSTDRDAKHIEDREQIDAIIGQLGNVSSFRDRISGLNRRVTLRLNSRTNRREYELRYNSLNPSFFVISDLKRRKDFGKLDSREIGKILNSTP